MDLEAAFDALPGLTDRVAQRRMAAAVAEALKDQTPLLVHATKQILDNWGDDGWELVAVIPGPNPEQLVAYLKRPKSAP